MTQHPRTGVYPPLHGGRVAGALIGCGLILAVALSLVGWAIVHLATYLANTATIVALLIVMVLVLRVWLGRWRESVVLVMAIAGELLIFVTVAAVVNRPRPDVPLLDMAPPTSSFPSGHTGAAVAFYGCLAIIMVRQLRPRWFAVTITTVLCVVPIFVAVSRLYRGMHHPTDVVFGVVCGGVWLAVVLTTLLPAPPRRAELLTRRPLPDDVPQLPRNTVNHGPDGPWRLDDTRTSR